MGSVFLITLPLVLVALVLARVCVPGHTNEATDPVDHLGGILSVLGIALLVLAVNFASVPDDKPFTVIVGALHLIAMAAVFRRQRRVRAPLTCSPITRPRTLRTPLQPAAKRHAAGGFSRRPDIGCCGRAVGWKVLLDEAIATSGEHRCNEGLTYRCNDSIFRITILKFRITELLSCRSAPPRIQEAP